MSEITGKLIVKKDEQTFGNNGFRKREFVVEVPGTYPQTIQLELVQDKCSLLDSFGIGDDLKIAYNLNGRKWTNKEGVDQYFNSIQAWKIDKVGGNDTLPGDQVPDSSDVSF